MTVFAGIDLAWSGRKPTGICILETQDGSVVLRELRCTPADATANEIAVFLSTLGPDVVAGIDAPLVVGTARRAEAELARVFGSRGVYAYSARHDFLERHGIAEGPRLGALLQGSGWNLDPALVTAGATGRHALEVFPHAGIVSLLGAPRALKYKKGTRAARLEPMREFQRLLGEHCAGGLECLLTEPTALLAAPFENLGRGDLKEVEDKLDAIVCAVSASHMWRHGPGGTLTFGDIHNGYIAVPRPVTSFPAPSSPSD